MLNAYLNILIFFAMIFIGYLLTWRRWFDSIVADAFSKLVLNITLPLGMFLNITQNFSKAEFLHLFKGMLLPLTSILATFVISQVVVRVMKVKPGRRGSFSTMFTASNTIFIGLPINLAIFGEISVPYVLLYYICNTTFFWTIGVYMIATDSPDIDRSKVRFSPVTALKKIFSPALLGFIVGIIWILGDFPKPSFLMKFCESLGNLTTPLSMFFLGIIIYQTGIKNIRLNRDVIGVLVGRFFISPLIVILLSFIIPVPDMMLKVFIVQASMPVQNSVPILARNYGGDTEFAATTLTYSVLVFLLLIPLLLKIVL